MNENSKPSRFAEMKKSFWKGADKLRQQWEENPLMVIGVAGASAAGISKLLDTLASVQSKRAYARLMKQRERERRS
jgi:hypothetical protein